MKINKQLFEDVLSGKLKGEFLLRNLNKVKSEKLRKNLSFNKEQPYAFYERGIFFEYKENGCFFSNEMIALNDIIDFIPESNMKEKELKIDIPEGYEIDKDNSTFERIVFKKKENIRPKSWEEFCESGIDKEYCIDEYSDINEVFRFKRRNCNTDRNLCKTEEEAEAFLALIQLKRLWHEYVDNYSEKTKDHYYYFIDCLGCKNEFTVLYDFSSTSRYLFKFPSKKLAEEFLNNFKDLFIKASLLWK